MSSSAANQSGQSEFRVCVTTTCRWACENKTPLPITSSCAIVETGSHSFAPHIVGSILLLQLSLVHAPIPFPSPRCFKNFDLLHDSGSTRPLDHCILPFCQTTGSFCLRLTSTRRSPIRATSLHPCGYGDASDLSPYSSTRVRNHSSLKRLVVPSLAS
jgi:hypothetical protein